VGSVSRSLGLFLELSVLSYLLARYAASGTRCRGLSDPSHRNLRSCLMQYVIESS